MKESLSKRRKEQFGTMSKSSFYVPAVERMAEKKKKTVNRNGFKSIAKVLIKRTLSNKESNFAAVKFPFINVE